MLNKILRIPQLYNAQLQITRYKFNTSSYTGLTPLTRKFSSNQNDDDPKRMDRGYDYDLNAQEFADNLPAKKIISQHNNLTKKNQIIKKTEPHSIAELRRLWIIIQASIGRISFENREKIIDNLEKAEIIEENAKKLTRAIKKNIEYFGNKK